MKSKTPLKKSKTRLHLNHSNPPTIDILEETALVVQTKDHNAWVQTRAKLSCTSCKLQTDCGQGILQKYFADKVFITKIDNSLSANTGDHVIISIAKSRITQAAFFIYGLPLCGLFAGAIFGELLNTAEAISILLAVCGLIGGFLSAKFFMRYLMSGVDFQPKMTKIVNTSVQSDKDIAVLIKE